MDTFVHLFICAAHVAHDSYFQGLDTDFNCPDIIHWGKKFNQ